MCQWHTCTIENVKTIFLGGSEMIPSGDFDRYRGINSAGNHKYEGNYFKKENFIFCF